MCSLSTLVTLTFCLEWMYVLTVLQADPQYSNGEGFSAIFLSPYHCPQTKLLEVCPYGWDLIGDECFYFSDMTDTKNISEAVVHCESFKPAASMYIPYNETSIAMIMQAFLDKYPSASPHDGLVHLGITQKINATTGVEEWYWGSGQLIPNGYWCPGQPGWDSSSQPVLSMRRNTSGGVCFHDTDVVDMRPYICRQDVYSRCPDGYTLFNGRCFILTLQGRKFDVGEAECNKLPGGHLAAIRSIDDFEFLKELRGTRSHIWLGLTDKDEEGTWMFTDGTALDSTFTMKSDGPAQNCGVLRIEENNLLDDDECTKPKGYICMSSVQHTFIVEHDTTDIDFNKLLDDNPSTCIDSGEILMNKDNYQLNMMTSSTPDGVTISVTFNEIVTCSKRPVLFTSVYGTDCGSLKICQLITGRYVTSTSCLYRCPCDDQYECHVVLLDLKKRYIREPAHICDVINVA